MPRRNRRHGSRDTQGPPLRSPLANRRTERRLGFSWSVQPVGAGRSEKVYRCPGCSGDIAPGVKHIVVWREDGVLGDRADLEARRHWHERCWAIA